MDMNDAVRARRSIREYDGRALPGDIIEKIIDSGRFAPTARGIQPWEFIVVTRKEALKDIAAEVENGRFIASASACVAIFCKDTKYYLEDGCAACQNLLLTAASLGVGSCWVAGDKKEYCLKISGMLGVSDGYKLVCLISLGYPKAVSDLKIKEKRALKEVLHWEKF